MHLITTLWTFSKLGRLARSLLTNWQDACRSCRRLSCTTCAQSSNWSTKCVTILYETLARKARSLPNDREDTCRSCRILYRATEALCLNLAPITSMPKQLVDCKLGGLRTTSGMPNRSVWLFDILQVPNPKATSWSATWRATVYIIINQAHSSLGDSYRGRPTNCQRGDTLRKPLT